MLLNDCIFYFQGSAIKFLAPTKSCLGGSSKHNTNLNTPKTKSAPKKRVQFKENLEEVRFIDPVPGTRRLGSSKDADRPKAMSETVKLPKPTASDEAILQDVIYDISKWNPIWLRVCFILSFSTSCHITLPQKSMYFICILLS